MHRIIKIMVPLILLTITAGCGVKITYKFTGASIPVEAKNHQCDNLSEQGKPGGTRTDTNHYRCSYRYVQGADQS